MKKAYENSNPARFLAARANRILYLILIPVCVFLLFVTLACFSLIYDEFVADSTDFAMVIIYFVMGLLSLYPGYFTLKCKKLAEKARKVSEELCIIREPYISYADFETACDGKISVRDLDLLINGKYLKNIHTDAINKRVAFADYTETKEKMRVVNAGLNCPSCGATVTGKKGATVICEYCGNAVKIL